MKPDLQRRVQRYGWDRAADFYEDAWRSQLKPAQDRMLSLAAISEGERVLDVASGTGLVTFRVAERVGPAGEVVGIDLSDRMVETAADRARNANLTNVSFRQMSAEALDFPDQSFDLALCALGLMYVPDPVLSLREMQRVLRPTGRCAVAVWGEREACGWAEVFPIVDRRVKTDVCPLFFQLGTGDALAFALSLAGYSDISLHRLNYGLEYGSDQEVLSAIFAGGPVALAYRKFDEATRAEVHAEFLDSIASFRKNDGGYAIPGEFVVAAAMRI